MAIVATPSGAEPIGTLSGSGSFTGKQRAIKIGSAATPSIYYGDFVKLTTGGTVVKDEGSATMTPVGIFMGCSYTDPNTKQPTYSQYWPTGLVAADAVAYVVDDPNVLFRMQADATIAQSGLGANAAVIQTAGSALFGRSKNAVNATVATTAAMPLRIIEFVDGPFSAVGDTYTDVICKFNAGHQYQTALGII